MPRLRALLATLALLAGCENPEHYRTLVVGLDGGDWRVIEPLMHAGFLPTFERLVLDGAVASLDCTPAAPPFLACFCPPVWTTIVTGVDSPTHRIVHLPVWEGSHLFPNRFSYHRRAPALWNLFAERGLTSTVVSWRGAWPPEEDQEVNLTEMGLDWLAHRTYDVRDVELREIEPLYYRDRRTRPVGLFEELGLWPPQQEPEVVVSYLARDRLAMEALDRLAMEALDRLAMEALDRLAMEALDRLGSRPPTSLTLVILHSPDKSSHLAWDEVQHAPGVPLDEEALFELAAAYEGPVVGDREWGDPVSQYVEIDRWLERHLASRHYDHVVLVSDHGMEWNPQPDGLPGAHNRHVHRAAHRSVFVVSGRHARRGFELGERVDGRLAPSASVLDVAPTLMALHGLEPPDAMQGRVLREMLRPQLAARDAKRLRGAARRGLLDAD